MTFRATRTTTTNLLELMIPEAYEAEKLRPKTFPPATPTFNRRNTVNLLELLFGEKVYRNSSTTHGRRISADMGSNT